MLEPVHLQLTVKCIKNLTKQPHIIYFIYVHHYTMKHLLREWGCCPSVLSNSITL